MQEIRPCLAFSDQAEEAVNFYVSVFPDSEILSTVRSDGTSPIPEGKLLNATFRLGGREYTAMDGGPQFSFSEGFSLVATCETQRELDEVWGRLCDGGEEGPCGWCKDRFGVSWQVVPSQLGDMMANPTGGDTAKLMQALLGMHKIDVAALQRAYGSPS